MSNLGVPPVTRAVKPTSSRVVAEPSARKSPSESNSIDTTPIGLPGQEIIRSHRRIVLLAEGHSDLHFAKTALSLIRFRSDHVVGWLDSSLAATKLSDCFSADFLKAEVPVYHDLAEVPAVDALYIGVAIAGGQMPSAMKRAVGQAAEMGIDVVSGMHDHLCNDASLVATAAHTGTRLIDVRRNRFDRVATAQPLVGPAIRIHTIGQDCSVGKMVTSVELARALKSEGYDAAFLPTGQTGIMIQGDGVPVDAVVADFTNGAVENLVRENQHRDFTVLEGQGSLLHPAYSSVTLSLLHGGQPHGIVLCYEPGRPHTKSYPHVPLPSLGRIRQLIDCLSLPKHTSQLIAIAMNGRRLSTAEAEAEKCSMGDRLNVPVCDVVRDGPSLLVDAAKRLRNRLQIDHDGDHPPVQ